MHYRSDGFGLSAGEFTSWISAVAQRLYTIESRLSIVMNSPVKKCQEEIKNSFGTRGTRKKISAVYFADEIFFPTRGAEVKKPEQIAACGNFE